MSHPDSNAADDASQRLRALSRWDNEGGAGCNVAAEAPTPGDEQMLVPDLTNAELVAMRVRIIALENLLIALLATASEQQLGLAHDMADYISPRPGFTHHPLTTHAAAHMLDLIERSSRFHSEAPS